MSSMRSKITLAASASLMSTTLAFAQAQPGETDAIAGTGAPVKAAVTNAIAPTSGAAGLVENGWDFTAPAGVPGFGPMRPDDDMAAPLAQALGRQASPPVVVEAAHQARSEPRPAR